MPCLASVQRAARSSDEPMTWLVETTNAATIDAMSLSEVFNLKKDHGIMQAACNNLGARLAQDAFVSIGWNSGMGDFWRQSRFRR